MEKTSWVKLYFNILKSWFIDYFDNIFVKYFPAWDEWKKISNHLQTKKLVLFLKYTISKEQGRRSLLFLGVPLLDMSKPPTSDFDNVVFFFINFMKGHFDRLSVSVKKKNILVSGHLPCIPLVFVQERFQEWILPQKYFHNI